MAQGLKPLPIVFQGGYEDGDAGVECITHFITMRAWFVHVMQYVQRGKRLDCCSLKFRDAGAQECQGAGVLEL